ncbi:MAG: hypothetical protein K8L91_25815 [Anaerolineae bacterium]|nr:hypothetical protein [Anaerolineae bacterium]
MTALDSCEPQIIRALEKDGWAVLRKPHTIKTNRRSVFADFSLQRGVNGRMETIIVVEVKCFANEDDDLDELYRAVGQYQYYRLALNRTEQAYPLYLALPNVAYYRLVTDTTVQEILRTNAVKLIVVDLVEEVVVLWLP